ncbi:hypothetical protein GCM10009834_03410 [Streptomonospora arabica]
MADAVRGIRPSGSAPPAAVEWASVPAARKADTAAWLWCSPRSIVRSQQAREGGWDPDANAAGNRARSSCSVPRREGRSPRMEPPEARVAGAGPA